jgi:hypothetical protein
MSSRQGGDDYGTVIWRRITVAFEQLANRVPSAPLYWLDWTGNDPWPSPLPVNLTHDNAFIIRIIRELGEPQV